MTTMAEDTAAALVGVDDRVPDAQPAPPGPLEPPVEPSEDRPRNIGARPLDETASLWGSLVAALALVWVLYEQVLAWSGSLGFVVCYFVSFLGLYAGVTALGNPRTVVVDRLAGAVITWAAVVVACALVSTIVYTFVEGWPALVHVNFYTQDMAGVGPQDPLTEGGVLHAIVGSVIEVSIAAIFALPLGIATAVYLTEVGGRGSMLVRTVVEAMTALPDVLAGLFVYVTLIVGLGVDRSGIAAAAALFIMMLPIIARSAEVQLRVVPGGLREAGLALGASRWSTVRRVVLPTAKAGLATALILGIARAVGETAPVLITSGATTFMNLNPFSEPDELAAAVHPVRRPQRRAHVHHPRLRRGQRAAGDGARAVRPDPLPRPRPEYPSMIVTSDRGPAGPAAPCSSVAGLAALVASGAAPAGAAVSHAADPGLRLQLVGERRHPVDRGRRAERAAGRLLPVRVGAVGRKDFANKTTDYAVSDIGYLGKDPITGELDTSPGPLVRVPADRGRRHGVPVPDQGRRASRSRNLRLSGLTLAKIFTNRITNWNDPAITADNNGRRLPSLTIIPVVHSEGSGSSAQFTKYLDTQYPSVWRPFLGQAGSTEYFPRKGPAIAQSGSDGVMNFVASAAANGAIGYDEYSYALGKNFPVAKVENSAGYFNAPTQYNVAVALTKAQINFNHNDPTCPTGPANCYLLQKLQNVYVNPDTRTYPLSSYSYMIIPTAANDSKMTTAKRQTLADFLYYSLCQGQAEMGPIGYSPLPINLVQASFTQTALLKTADPNVDLTSRNVTTCHNPTFVAGQPTRNYLAEIAPKPPACDKAGAGPCTGNEGVTNGNPSNGKAPSTAPSAQTSASATSTAPATAGPSTSPSVDPLTGQSDPSTVAGGSDLVGNPTEISSTGPGSTTGLLAGLAVAEILLILVLPPVLARKVWRRRDSGGSGGSS